MKKSKMVGIKPVIDGNVCVGLVVDSGEDK